LIDRRSQPVRPSLPLTVSWPMTPSVPTTISDEVTPSEDVEAWMLHGTRGAEVVSLPRSGDDAIEREESSAA
jgi:hypothetical protein